jgi:sRNA-binding carbon storage regulator CsrA
VKPAVVTASFRESPVPTLTIGRYVEESVHLCLPDGRLVTVLVGRIIGGKRVRLVITAPKDVRIYRDEILPEDKRHLVEKE